ncbi:MAG TPA: xanthine dehydrogenase family protein molybdopterin-binding subunit [Candidatus Micrarchaeia archaeon]|nr:xanthine dehydrogenase family protein molybdopterin-binding subunit [Candidatus Micrarchaeia archaeon]
MAVTQLIGARIQRREDPRLVTGHGRYTEDLIPGGCATLQVVRSPHPHARIRSIDIGPAAAAPGVLRVLVAADFHQVLQGAMPVTPSFVADKRQVPARFPIADDEVVYQGEPVAVVVAGDRAAAADAAELVAVDYEPLPAVVEVGEALRPGSPRTHLGAPDNVCWDVTYSGGDVASAFADAEVVVRERILQQRLAPTPIEGRVVVAEHHPYDGRMTIWLGSQNPHFIRLFVSQALGMAETQVRVVSRDVGGGFGSKISPYPEDYLVPAAATLVHRPVKWVETRTEAMSGTTHGRGQVFDVEVAAKRDGTLLGMRLVQTLDVGAYCGTFGAFQAVAVYMAPGCYRWRGVEGRTIGVLTNKVPTDPYRGAGRPEGTHLVERMVDRVAGELAMDPAEVRRRNFAADFPFTNPFGFVYDSGDYHKTLARACSAVDYDGLRRRQTELRAQGRYLGIGLSTYVEICGFGPSAPTAAATGGIALVEGAQVRVFPTGSVAVHVGTHAHGQGHDTTFSQIVADTLGIPLEQVRLHHGDTDEGTGFGYGTYGSRSLSVGGMAVLGATVKVVEKARRLAAHLLEADEQDVVFEAGRFGVRGSPRTARSFAEVALAAYGANLPDGMEQGLEAVHYFDPANFVWPFGAHVGVVEVDVETGQVAIERYVAVDDCGTVINPMIVEGQVQGGIAQGIAQALFEEVVYDPDTGQLRTATLVDYLVPTMSELPVPELSRTVTPSPTNALGVKGVGEAGTIAASAAVINAICDALAPLGIRHVDMPASPDRLWRQIQEARRA